MSEQIPLPVITPQEERVIELVRAFLGNISSEELPDQTILLFWNKWAISFDLEKYPDRFGLALYNTVIDCVRWLIVQEVSSGNSSVRERMEKIGDETISIKGGSSWESWKDFLDWLLLNPDYIDPSLSQNASLIIIGGVRKDEFFRVKNNPNSYNGFMEQGVYPTKAIPTRSRWNATETCGRKNPWVV